MHLNKKRLWAMVTFFSCIPLLSRQIPITLDPHYNSGSQMIHAGLIQPGNAIRLHLGCGQQYLHGYINIDLPAQHHTTQNNSVADCFADITQLKFYHNTIDEIRSHHVFEHFWRAQALNLICQWHQWLKVGGLLVIETPDFLTCCKQLLYADYSEQQTLLRHMFGSQEASWAIHYDGWYKEKFKRVLETLGFELLTVQKNSWHGTYNICVTAQKQYNIDASELRYCAQQLLQTYMVDTSPSEKIMWDVWCNQLN